MLTLLLIACHRQAPPGDGLVDGIRLPDVSRASFVDGVDHPFFPLPVGASWDYRAATAEGTEEDHVEVLPDRRDVHGVSAVVVYDAVTVDGELAEETWDWYAQDDDGNVWYLGEDTCEYEGGACAVRAGSWEWGKQGALPGILMPGSPEIDGRPYFQEYLKGEAEDVGEVIGVGEARTVAAGTFDDCLRTRDTSHLDPSLQEEKVYCRDVGNVFVHEPGGDVELVASSLLP